MLTLDREQTTALDYSVVNTSIQETFTAIDRFEWQASDELRLMRDKGYYEDGGHKSFEAYCESELTKHGGYRRVRDLLSAKKVVDTLPEELREKITKPSQTRSLLRLVKTPDKLHEAVAIAAKEKPFPTAADFAKAVGKVVPKNTSPTRTSSTKQEKVKMQLCNSVTVSSLSDPRYGESGVIEADAPNNYQQIVTFADGERILVNNSDLTDAIVSESSERTYPKEYTEVIAAIEERHKQELERLSPELRIGLQTEVTARAEAQVQEQIQSLQQLFKQQKEENIQLQQRLDEMEGLRKLEIENQQLKQRIQDLENAKEPRTGQDWGNTYTKQGAKALNKRVQQALEKTIAQSPYKRLHVIIPIEDMLWASQQKPSVNQLWQECWTADPYGSRWMPLTSALGYSTFISAKKILSESGLFIFKPDKSIQDGRETASWMVKNLHGSRMKEFWEKANSASPKPDAEKRESNAENTEMNAGSKEMGALYKASISVQINSEQGFQETSRTAQEHLTNSFVEFVRCNSDTLTEISHCEEAVIAPLRVASPQSVGGVSEKEKDLPMAMDCTTLAFVEAVQGESASLLAENQNCGVEPKDCYEGTCSAALIAQNEKSLNSAIANQTREQLEQGYSATLLVKNSVSGGEVKANHERESSATSAPIAEKWSHEAIVARSNLRPERMQKLKVAANSGQNPGFDFLQECWNDDPALQIVIKKLLVKFPQWGLAIVDGTLVKSNK